MPRPTSASGFSRSRSATSSSASSSGASLSEGEMLTVWPAAPRLASTLLPSIRSVEMPTTRATRGRGPAPLEGASLAELFADALGASPHLHDLRPALSHLAQPHLTGDAFAVELVEHAEDRLRRGGVAE